MCLWYFGPYSVYPDLNITWNDGNIYFEEWIENILMHLSQWILNFVQEDKSSIKGYKNLVYEIQYRTIDDF